MNLTYHTILNRTYLHKAVTGWTYDCTEQAINGSNRLKPEKKTERESVCTELEQHL